MAKKKHQKKAPIRAEDLPAELHDPPMDPREAPIIALFGASQIARDLGCDRSTVSRLCRRLGLGRKYAPPPAPLLLDLSEIDALRRALQRGPGNPAMRGGGKPASRLAKKAIRTRFRKKKT